MMQPRRRYRSDPRPRVPPQARLKNSNQTKFADGDYVIDFPPGTWYSFPVRRLPFGLPGAFPIAEVGSITSPGDGSATAHVRTSSTAGPCTPHDVAFWFIATAS
jgi:hypothetical protein